MSLDVYAAVKVLLPAVVDVSEQLPIAAWAGAPVPVSEPVQLLDPSLTNTLPSGDAPEDPADT